MFALIVAMDQKQGIGNGNQLPWRIKKDMAFFTAMTLCKSKRELLDTEKKFGLLSISEKKHEASFTLNLPEETLPPSEVIMGRKNWESIPKKFRPLKSRKNKVLTRNEQFKLDEENTSVFRELKDSLEFQSNSHVAKPLQYVIGGGEIYAQSILLNDCKTLYITEVDVNAQCEVFFPEIPNDFDRTAQSHWLQENDYRFRFTRWDKD